MKVTFASNYLNVHQRPFCDEMLSLLGKNDFRFVASTPFNKLRLRSGYEDMNQEPFVIRAYDYVGDYFPDVTIVGLFSKTLLWYWLCAIVTFITKNTLYLRLLNIVFATITIKVVYDFAANISSIKTANSTVWILALSPYAALFSCFIYKDTLIMLLIFSLMAISTDIRQKGIHAKAVLLYIINVLALFAIRGGIAVLLLITSLVICMGSSIYPTLKRVLRFAIGTLPGLVIVVASLILVVMSYDTLMFKMEYYFQNASRLTSSNTMAGFFTINSLVELYKLPFSYAYSLFVLLASYSNYHNWYGIAGQLNFFYIPVAVGAGLYLFKKKEDSVVYWGLMFVYLVSLISGVGVFRHYYSLLPFNYYCCSAYLNSNSKYSQIVLSLLSILVSMLFLYYFFK